MKKINLLKILSILILTSCSIDDLTIENIDTSAELITAQKFDYSKSLDLNQNLLAETRPEFIWGINGHSLSQNSYRTNISIDKTVDYLEQLNVNMYRLDMHVNEDGFLFNGSSDSDLRDFKQKLTEKGIKILPFISTTKSRDFYDDESFSATDDIFYTNLKNNLENLPTQTISDIKSQAFWNTNYNYAKNVGLNFTARDVGKFDYYNVSNEVVLDMIKRISHPTNLNPSVGSVNEKYFYENVGSGDEINHVLVSKEYAKRIVASCAFTAGLIDGIKQNQPNAKIIITGTKNHYGYHKFLNLMGVNYDIVGWNWYSDYGQLNKVASHDTKNISVNLNKYGMKHGLNLYNELMALRDNIWLTEINEALGSQGTKYYEEQANTIRTSMKEMFEYDGVKAYIVYELLDGGVDDENGNLSTSEEAEKSLGLITSPLLGENMYKPKPAFDTYKYSIEEYKYGYHDFLYAYYLLYRGDDDRSITNDNRINAYANEFANNGYTIPRFLNSFLANDAVYFVEKSFELILNQTNISTDTKTYYVNALENGWSREFFLSEIGSSQTFLNRAQEAGYENTNGGSDVSKSFISHVFMKFFGRLPKPVDLNTGSFAGDDNRQRRRDYFISILNSEEYIKDFINSQYKIYLERDAESTGLNSYYDTWRQQNWGQEDLIKNILNSDEFWRKSIIRGYNKRHGN